jgi:hypothetical protein
MVSSPQDQWLFIERRAAELGVSAEALRKWRERTVPHKYRLGLIRDAAAAGITIDDSTFDHPPGKTSEAA